VLISCKRWWFCLSHQQNWQEEGWQRWSHKSHEPGGRGADEYKKEVLPL
jgi:hypothetical protein